MDNVAEKVSMVEFVQNRDSDFIRKYFEPVSIVASESHIQGDYVFDFAAMNGTVTDPCASGDETEKEGLFAFVLRAFEEVALCRRKYRFKKLFCVGDTIPRHFEEQVMFIFVAILF